MMLLIALTTWAQAATFTMTGKVPAEIKSASLKLQYGQCGGGAYFCFPYYQDGRFSVKNGTFTATANILKRNQSLHRLDFMYQVQTSTGLENEYLSMYATDSETPVIVPDYPITCAIKTEKSEKTNGYWIGTELVCRAPNMVVPNNANTSIQNVTLSLNEMGFKVGATLLKTSLKDGSLEFFDNGHGMVGPRSKVIVSARNPRQLLLPTGTYFVEKAYYNLAGELVFLHFGGKTKLNGKTTDVDAYYFADVDHPYDMNQGWESYFKQGLAARNTACAPEQREVFHVRVGDYTILRADKSQTFCK